MSDENTAPQRLLSLDCFRGLVMIFMIVVNTPGSFQNIYASLQHAPWDGVTPAGLVFPFFLFIVGVSIALAYSQKITPGVSKQGFYYKIIVRFLKLFIIGVFLDFWYHFDPGQLRIAGVLQRIAIVFAVCAVLFIHTHWRQQIVIAGSILGLYWVLLTWLPVPIDDVNRRALESGEIERGNKVMVKVEVRPAGPQAIAPNLEPGTNLAAWLDRRLIPGRLYEKTWDPEGVLSTLPAMVNCLLGMLIGQLLLVKREQWERIAWVFFAGSALCVGGAIWSWTFPFNKQLWTSSFVLWTVGLAALFLAAFLLIVDTLGWRRMVQPALVFGANPITAFVLATMLDPLRWISFKGFSLNRVIMDGLALIGVRASAASLLCAVIYSAMVYVPIAYLYRRRIFIRL